jgi:hypothetical protein
MARLRLAIEEHGAGCQLVRVRSWPYAPKASIALGVLAALVASLALVSDADAVTAVLGAAAVALVMRLVYECGLATVTIRQALRGPAGAVRAAPSVDVLEPLPLGTLVN